MKEIDITVIPEAERDRNPEHITAHIARSKQLYEDWVAEYVDRASPVLCSIKRFLLLFFESHNACVTENCPFHPLAKLCVYKDRLYVIS